MAKAFWVDPSDKNAWLNGENLDLSKNWVKKEDKGIRKNVWAVLKQLFYDISVEPKITNRAKHNYDRITLGQFLFFMILVRIRTRMVFNMP